MSNDLAVISAAEARVLGCLIEKKQLTPDVYPLTLNGAHAAANQKTARDPVMSLELAEVRRLLAELERKGLVRQAFASRVERYEHLMAQVFSLTQIQIALVGVLMLRGPQTLNELFVRAERMATFQSIDDVRTNLDLLIGRKPALVQLLERGPGKREDRYAHLLCGEVVAPAPARAPMQTSTQSSDLAARVLALEEEVAEIRKMLAERQV
jgi:uncharacterized protein YceH (UPF0502 family)